MTSRRTLLPALCAAALAAAACATTERDDDDVAEAQELTRALSGGTSISLSLDTQFHRVVLESYFRGSEGLPNRFKVYEHLGRDRAYLVFVNGRSEFMDKYDVLFTSLHEYPLGDTPLDQTFADLPLSVLTQDHSGQGLSTEGRVRGHIDDFDTFVADLRTLTRALRKVNPRRPIYLLSHSMGGLISVRLAQQSPELVDGLILTSPLLRIRDIPGLPEPAFRFATAFYTEISGMPRLCTAPPGVDQQTLISLALCAGGLLEEQLPGCQACFHGADSCVPEVQAVVDGLRGAFTYLSTIAEDGCPDPTFACPAPFVSTDDAYCDYAQTHPLAGPEATFGWLSAALAATDAFATGPTIEAPVLLMGDTQDVVVNPAAYTCAKFADCEVRAYPGFGHELLTSVGRAEVIAEIRRFLGF